MFDRRITLGNVLTMLAMLLAGVGAFYTQSVEIEAQRRELTVAIEETRGRLMVQQVRIDFIDSDTKRRLGRIEDKLDQLLSAQ